MLSVMCIRSELLYLVSVSSNLRENITLIRNKFKECRQAHEIHVIKRIWQRAYILPYLNNFIRNAYVILPQYINSNVNSFDTCAVKQNWILQHMHIGSRVILTSMNDTSTWPKVDLRVGVFSLAIYLLNALTDKKYMVFSTTGNLNTHW